MDLLQFIYHQTKLMPLNVLCRISVSVFQYYLSKFKILDKGMLPFVAIKIPNHEMLNMLLQLCKYLEYLTL